MSDHTAPRLGAGTPWHRRAAQWLAVAAAVGIVAGWEGLLRAPAVFLVETDPIDHVDAVVVLSGDDGTRLPAAAAIQRRGDARWLIIIPATPEQRYHEGSALRRQAVSLGVPAERVIVAPASYSTAQDADLATQIMTSRGFVRAAIVTAPYQSRRAKWIFQAVGTPLGLDVVVVPAVDRSFRTSRWWADSYSRRIVLQEYVKWAAYLFGVSGTWRGDRWNR